jgi:HK97 family phage prohead protease
MNEVDALQRCAALRAKLRFIGGPDSPFDDPHIRATAAGTVRAQLAAAERAWQRLRRGRKFVPGGRQRAWSTFTTKAIDTELREIEGWATTPSVDRASDVIDPRGCRMALPLPFCWQHDDKAPIGRVLRADVTDAGIKIKAQIARLSQPSPLKDVIDTAWAAIKAQLVTGLSIGFRPLAAVPINGGGLRFTKSEILEISAVTVPCNIEAQISLVRAS